MNEKELLQAMYESMQEIKGDIREMKGDISELKEDVSELKGEVKVLKEDVGVLKEDVEVLKQRSDTFEKRLDTLTEEVHSMRQDMGTMNERLMKIEVSLENETNHNIQLLAENHITLIDKLNQAIRVTDKTLLYEVQVSGFKMRVEKLEKEVEDLKSRIA